MYLRSSGRTGRSGTDFALPACMHAVRLGRFLGASFLVVCGADVPVSDWDEVGWAITWGCFVVLRVGCILAGGRLGGVRFSLFCPI